MLKLTVRGGEYLNIGDDIRIIFTGGSVQTIHVLVDAPKEYNIARSSAVQGNDKTQEKTPKKYFRDADLSPEARFKIQAILAEERRKAKKQIRESENS